MFKVKDFIRELQKFNQEAIVIISSDAEGNNYSPFSDICEGFYLKDNSWSGDFVSGGIDEDDYDEEERAICLFPI
jgi:hypothetical protein